VVAHAHQVVIDPVTGDILVVDLGTDSIHGYRLAADGRLTRSTGSGWRPGAGRAPGLPSGGDARLRRR
jgi:6-phosphogluconolactonase